MSSLNESSVNSGSASYFYEEGEEEGEYSSLISDSRTEERSLSVNGSGGGGGRVEAGGTPGKLRQRRRRRVLTPGGEEIPYLGTSQLSGTARSTDLGVSLSVSQASPESSAYSDDTELTPMTPLESPSDLSSSLSHLLYESEVADRVRRVWRVLERPVLFLVVSAAGSRLVRALGRLSNTVLLTRQTGGTGDAPPGGMEPCVPEGYPGVPAWLQELRASLPTWLVERPLSHLLRRAGVPILADALEQQRVACEPVTAVGECVRALEASSGGGDVWLSSGPMIPAAVFLPVLTLVLLRAARAVSDRRLAELGSAAGGANHDVVGSDSELVSEVGHEPYRDVSPPATWMETVEAAVDSPVAQRPAGSPSERAAERGAGAGDSAAAAGAGAGAAGPGGRALGSSPSPSPAGVTTPAGGVSPETLSPPSTRYVARRSETREPADVGPSGTVEYIRTPKGRAVSPMDLSSKSSTHLVPSPIVSSPSTARMFAAGAVIAALVGTPTVAEVNRVLVASATYGCVKAILPASAQELAHIAVPPSASVEYSSSVLDAVLEVANRRGMAMVGVLARATPSVPGAVHLRQFEHPATCIYVFRAGAGTSAEEVAQVVDRVVYVFERGPADAIPINECFSQRLSDTAAREGNVREVVP